MDLTALLTSLGVGGGSLASVVWWLIRRHDTRLTAEAVERTRITEAEREQRQDALKDEREAREKAAAADREMFLSLYKAERDARDTARDRYEEALQQARHDLRDELTVIANKQAGHELYCAREYVSYPRLVEALKPLTESQERIFAKLDTKADKNRPAGH